MKLLYPKFLDKTPVKVNIINGSDINGKSKIIFTYTGLCCFNEKIRSVYNSEGKLIQLSGSLTIGKDIAPEIDIITGNVEIKGRLYTIYKSGRPKNPDGTVNHTELELI
jgi:hypothetical protein